MSEKEKDYKEIELKSDLGKLCLDVLKKSYDSFTSELIDDKEKIIVFRQEDFFWIEFHNRSFPLANYHQLYGKVKDQYNMVC